MLAGIAFGIERTPGDDWFDTILDVDTELFVDPFTIFKETSGPWEDAHDRLVGHFNRAFILIAEGNRNPASPAYKKALALLEFKEPHELCLGYTAKGTRGSGSSGCLAGLMAEAIVAAIERGLEHPSHFEELGILQERIGGVGASEDVHTQTRERDRKVAPSLRKNLRVATTSHCPNSCPGAPLAPAPSKQKPRFRGAFVL
jgi:hypothetical protein